MKAFTKITYEVSRRHELFSAVCHQTKSATSNCSASRQKFTPRGDGIVIVPQTCVEFWNVATRPLKHNGFGFSVADADFFLRLIERLFPLLPEDARIYREWRKLVLNFGVSGVQVHDARIVAAMLVQQVTHILTFNLSDFARFSSLDIVAVDPNTL